MSFRRGRVIATSENALLLMDEGRVHEWECPALSSNAEVGDLVEVQEGKLRILHKAALPEWPPAQGQAGDDLGRFTPRLWERLRQRAFYTQKLRSWFDKAGFLEVSTPLLVPSPGTEVHLDPIEALLQERPGAPLKSHWLIPSPEYAMKRLLAAGSPPIYQICKVFRNGERGDNHRPEFTMLEWYRPYESELEVLMADCENLIRTLAGDSLRWKGVRYDLRGTWPRQPFFTLLKERAGVSKPETLSTDEQLYQWVDKVEPTLGQDGPEFVTKWPIEMASLAKRSPENPLTAERFELYLGSLELANAFSELADPKEQRRRCLEENATRQSMKRQKFPLDEDFLGALEAGMPPSVGIALGLDRLMMCLTGATSIDEVLSF